MNIEVASVYAYAGERQLTYTPLDAISTAVESMKASFSQGAMRDMSFRKQQLQSLLQGIREHRHQLAAAVAADFSKPPTESEFYEIAPVIFEIGQFLKDIDKWARPDEYRLGSEQPVFLMSSMEVRKEPLGTVLIISPWNYPLRLILLPLIGALAAGNTVVLKPSELAPCTAVAVEDLVAQFLDPNVVCVVQGAAAETTELLRHRFDHLFFTGSSTVGRLVGKAAMEHLAGVTLELGGKSPAIVHHDVADLGPAAMRIMWSKLTTAGQTCVATDYVMVHRLVKDRFVQLCKNFIENAYTRTPHKSPDYARIINRRHWQRIMDLLSATNGTVLQVCDDRPDQNDRYIPPTLVDNVAFDDPLMVDELFAPVLPIITYDSLDEVLQFVNSRDQPLAMYAFGSSKTTEFIFTNTRSGTAVANETMFVSAASNFPFGGVGASGIGRYMGKASFDTFSNHRTVLQAPLALPPPAIDSVRSPPFTGPENEWKQDAAGVAFPQNYWLRTTVLGKMFTFVPLWRLIDSVSTLASGLKYGRDMTKDNTDNV